MTDSRLRSKRGRAEVSRAIAEGVDPYVPIPVLANRFLGPLETPKLLHPTPHPPTAGLLLLPLASLDYPVAAAVWLVFELACLVASVHLLGRIAGLRPGIRATLISAGIALAWYPFPQDLALGQLMLPILLFLAGGCYALLSGRPLIGGALIGFSLLLKPIAWPLLLVFLVRREWRALAGALSIAVLGYGAALWAIGISSMVGYLTQVLPAVSRLYQVAYGNISAWTVGWRVFGGIQTMSLAAQPLVESVSAAAAVSVGLPALILMASLVAVLRQRNLGTSLGLMICVSILVSPISWNYYLALAAVPAVQVGSWLVRHRLPSRETNIGLAVALLMAPKDEWARMAFVVAGQSAEGGTTPIPFGPALFTLGPLVALSALTLLLLALPDVVPRRTHGGSGES